MATNRATIKELIIKYLNEQDTFSLPYRKLEKCFILEGANFDVCLDRMENIEIDFQRDEPFTITLKEPYRNRRK